jgi:hypothetical protein
MQSRQKSRTLYFMFFILCISNFTLIKIKVYLKTNNIRYGGVMHSKMVGKTTVNEVQPGVKFVSVCERKFEKLPCFRSIWKTSDPRLNLSVWKKDLHSSCYNTLLMFLNKLPWICICPVRQPENEDRLFIFTAIFLHFCFAFSIVFSSLICSNTCYLKVVLLDVPQSGGVSFIK